MTKQKVVAVTGEAHSAACNAVGPLAHKYGVAFVAGECWADNVTGAQIPEVFRVTVANSLVYSVAADWVKAAGFKNVAVIGENSDGVYVIANPAGLSGKPDTPLSRSFAEGYQKLSGRPANSVAMEGYDGVMVIAEAIKAAGSADPAKIVEALRNVKWEGTRGTIYFPQTKEPAWAFQQWPDVPIFVIQYDQPNQAPEKSQILWPKNQATTDKLYLTP